MMDSLSAGLAVDVSKRNHLGGRGCEEEAAGKHLLHGPVVGDLRDHKQLDTVSKNVVIERMSQE